MVDQRALKGVLEDWLSNPTWKEYYDMAPSDKCREYIALDFYASETEDEQAFEEMDAMLKDLGHDDLTYLYINAVGPEKAKFAKLLK